MVFSADQAIQAARELKSWRVAERADLDEVRRYWRGRQRMPFVIPKQAPFEVHEMARVARVNVCQLIVDTFAQSLFVDGFRGREDHDNAEVWRAWQANRMDRHQTGLHRAMIAYGTAYVVVLPGDNGMPVMRPASPRHVTALYGENPDWPMMALEHVHTDKDVTLWRLFDEEAVYYVDDRPSSHDSSERIFSLVDEAEHGVAVGGEPVCPVVRYVSEEDLDVDDEPGAMDSRWRNEPVAGQIAPLMPLQDQIDMTTFSLLVAQHYGAFKQRYILGWTGETEEERLKASAARTWQFEDHPDDVQVGEFSQTQLDGHINSRKELLRYAAVLAQSPVHELIGEMVNLSAEALAAAEAGRDRKNEEHKTLAGESHEQTFQLVGSLMGVDVPEDAQVWWRDTTSRSLQQTVDALVKMTQGLGVPPEHLWERIPNVTQQDVERWQATAQEADSLDRLAEMLERQDNSVA